jgi:hypothetical protein
MFALVLFGPRSVNISFCMRAHYPSLSTPATWPPETSMYNDNNTSCCMLLLAISCQSVPKGRHSETNHISSNKGFLLFGTVGGFQRCRPIKSDSTAVTTEWPPHAQQIVRFVISSPISELQLSSIFRAQILPPPLPNSSSDLLSTDARRVCVPHARILTGCSSCALSPSARTHTHTSHSQYPAVEASTIIRPSIL